MPSRRTDRVPAGPFADWLNARYERYAAEHEHSGNLTETPLSPTQRVAAEIGWHGTGALRRLYRYRNTLTEASTGPRGRKERRVVASDTIARALVEDALDHAGVPFATVYPGLAVDVAIEPDAFCGRCHETVTPLGGTCPWCGSATSAERAGSERMYCAREDRMVHPALDGSCWRCRGTLTRGAPEQECACGCGARVRRFDHQGRGPIVYVAGHAPRSLERHDTLPAGPFAAYLREQTAHVDPLTATATKHRLKREQLVALLRGEVTEIPREQIRVGLWTARRYGQPKGPLRPGPSIQDLYPDDRLSRTCPGCGNAKKPAAVMCKSCRIRHDREHRRSGTVRDSSVTPDLLCEAAALLRAGSTLRAAAQQIQPRTRCTNVLSVSDALRKKLPRELWQQRGRKVPA